MAALQNDILSELQSTTGCSVKRGVSAKKLTTFAIGGCFDVLLEPHSLEELAAVVAFAAECSQPLRYLGAGSNLLVSDHGISDWVVKLGRGFRTVVERAAGEFEVGGSMSLMSLSRQLSQNGYTGLEFAGGIPASVGGAVRMNAGAHGGEMADVLREIQLVLKDGSVAWIAAGEFQFSYRSAALPDGAVIAGARIALTQSSVAETAKRRADYLEERKKRQPLTLPSAGSVFKNPSSDRSAGYLIEHAGLRGHCIGGASVSELHGNWIVNRGRQALCSDVMDLIEMCQCRVRDKFKVTLQPEVVRWQ